MSKKKIWLFLIVAVIFTAFYYIRKSVPSDPFERAAVQIMKDELRQDLSLKTTSTLNSNVLEKDLLISKIIETSNFQLINRFNSPDGSIIIQYEIRTIENSELRSLQDSLVKAKIKNQKWTLSEIETYISKIMPKKLNRTIVNSIHVNFQNEKLKPLIK